MSKIKPISPKELINVDPDIHESMIVVINKMLTHFDGIYLVLYQEKIIEAFLKLEPDISRDEIFDNGWLNFVGLYRRAGWDVAVDQPGYDESYETNYRFRIKE